MRNGADILEIRPENMIEAFEAWARDIDVSMIWGSIPCRLKLNSGITGTKHPYRPGVAGFLGAPCSPKTSQTNSQTDRGEWNRNAGAKHIPIFHAIKETQSRLTISILQNFRLQCGSNIEKPFLPS